MKRPHIISIVLFLVIGVAFGIPRPKYESLKILSSLNLPTRFAGWDSIDYAGELDLREDRYNFISDIFARLYKNRRGEYLLFLVLDAGNFHNPQVCYTSSGFKVEETAGIKIPIPDRTIVASALFMERHDLNMTMLYWLCIDKKIVDWAGQKFIELWSSIFNKKKAGLMVRLEIPTTGDRQAAMDLAKEFIEDLNNNLTEEQKEYLFGN